jgi:CRISPR-associated exonuclease Cas4
MGIEVFCEQYNIAGKIDVFDAAKGILTERKRSITVIYDGYVFQVFAQYFALVEMGYSVNKIVIHDLVHNKNYPIDLPTENLVMLHKFEQLIHDLNNYDLNDPSFVPKIQKCTNCIYNQLCDKSLC